MVDVTVDLMPDWIVDWMVDLMVTNGRIDVAPKGRCKTPAYIYSICIGFRIDPTKTLGQVQHTKFGLCVCTHARTYARTMAKISSMSQIT